MPKQGDKKDIGNGFTREYFDERWDAIRDPDGQFLYWRDKENHRTHEDDSSLTGILLEDQIGDEVDEFDDEDADEWNDDGDCGDEDG